MTKSLDPSPAKSVQFTGQPAGETTTLEGTRPVSAAPLKDAETDAEKNERVGNITKRLQGKKTGKGAAPLEADDDETGPKTLKGVRLTRRYVNNKGEPVITPEDNENEPKDDTPVEAKDKEDKKTKTTASDEVSRQIVEGLKASAMIFEEGDKEFAFQIFVETLVDRQKFIDAMKAGGLEEAVEIASVGNRVVNLDQLLEDALSVMTDTIAVAASEAPAHGYGELSEEAATYLRDVEIANAAGDSEEQEADDLKALAAQALQAALRGGSKKAG